MNQDPDAPDVGNLRQAFANMKDYVRQHKAGNLPAQKFAAEKAESEKPQNVCRICDAPFNHSKIAVAKPILTEPCPKCDGFLKEGFTALRAATRYAFVKFMDSTDLHGKIMDVSTEIMDEVEKAKNAKRN